MSDDPKQAQNAVEKLKSLPQAVLLGGGAVLVALVVLLVFASSGSGVVCEAPLSFDSKAWKENAEVKTPNSPRDRMVKHLTEKVLYKNMSRAQAEGIIGKSESKRFEKDYGAAYALGGVCGSDSGTTKWLVFKFNGSKLDSWKIITAD